MTIQRNIRITLLGILCLLMGSVFAFAQVGMQEVLRQQPEAANPIAPAATTVPTTEPSVDAFTKKLNQLTLDQIFSPQFWTQFCLDAIRWTISFIPRLAVAVFLMFFFWVIYRIVRKLIVGSMKAAGIDESIRDMLSHLIKWAILGFGLIIAGNQIGLEIAALLTGVSIIGLAVGFAAQESLSNFIAGIMIFLDKPFRVGDWIEIDGHLAQVKRVTFRSTRMTDLDGDVVVMPNMSMLSQKLINKSTNSVTRCCVQVGIAYGASIDLARATLLKMVTADTRIEKSPSPRVDVITLNASSVDLELRFWIREEEFEDALKYEYTEKAKVALDKAGVAIPFPHMQVVIEPSSALDKLSAKA